LTNILSVAGEKLKFSSFSPSTSATDVNRSEISNRSEINFDADAKRQNDF